MSDTTTAPPPAGDDRAGPPWASDHPGRKCSQCGLTVYPLWVDDTPPPGTCPEKSNDAAACRQNVDTAVTGMAFTLATQTAERLAEVREILKGRGLDPDRLEAYARDWIEIDRNPFVFGAGIAIDLKPLPDFLGTDPHQALIRATQIVVGMVWHLQHGIEAPADGNAWRDRFKRAWRHATNDLLGPHGAGPGGVDAVDDGDGEYEGDDHG